MSISDKQAEMLSQIYATQEIWEQPVATSILHKLVKYDHAIVKRILGPDGVTLFDFAQSVDLDHPHIKDVLDCALVNGAEIISQLLEVGKYLKEQEYDLLAKEFKYVVKRSLRNNNLCSLSNIHRVYVRLMKAEQRQKIRTQKKPERIDLSSILVKGDTVWASMPSDFEVYHYQSSQYLSLIEKAKNKAIYYKELGCESLYSEILKSIGEFENGFKQNYYGFHRIKMTEAAVILAKFNQFNLMENGLRPTICISGEKLGSNGACHYSPTMCPLHFTNWEDNEQIKGLIEFLENFPSVNKKPIFDHYIFVLPQVSIPEKCTYALKDGLFAPILLGEKDGKCYFICYGEGITQLTPKKEEPF